MHFEQLKRREFIALLGGGAAWPLAARAEQAGRVRRLGVLMGRPETTRWPGPVDGVPAAARGIGWTVGRTVRTDIRWQPRGCGLVAALRDGIQGCSPTSSFGMHAPDCSPLQGTRAVPIVFVVVSDPVAAGFVASLARPGGNVTGFLNIEGSLGGKWMELLKEIAPRVTRVAILYTQGGALSEPIGPWNPATDSLGNCADHGTRSRHSRARTHHRSARAYPEWRPDRDARCDHASHRERSFCLRPATISRQSTHCD